MLFRSYSESLKLLAKQHNVLLTGFISGEKLQEIYTHARLFILPSFHEGLPISLLEAMSYQLNVLVSNIPANIEVGLDKESYFAVDNPADLQTKLKAKLAEQVSLRSYNMKPYNWQEISKQILKVYEELVN